EKWPTKRISSREELDALTAVGSILLNIVCRLPLEKKCQIPKSPICTLQMAPAMANLSEKCIQRKHSRGCKRKLDVTFCAASPRAWAPCSSAHWRRNTAVQQGPPN